MGGGDSGGRGSGRGRQRGQREWEGEIVEAEGRERRSNIKEPIKYELVTTA